LPRLNLIFKALVIGCVLVLFLEFVGRSDMSTVQTTASAS
jgi:hypothetical protein